MDTLAPGSRVALRLPSAFAAAAVVVPGGGDRPVRPRLGPAYSPHNSYWSWGPPPDDAGTVLVVGYPEERLAPWFGRLEPAGRVDNGVGLENEEQGAPIWVATGRLASWAEIWPELRRLG